MLGLYEASSRPYRGHFFAVFFAAVVGVVGEVDEVLPVECELVVIPIRLLGTCEQTEAGWL